MVNVSTPESKQRKLMYFPIVHNQADMGALKDSVKSAVLKKLGRLGWKRRVNVIDEFWNQIEKTIDELALPFDRIRVYQDGLPVSGKEPDIVRELAKSGSRNHALLLRMLGKHAQIMGTESLELLLEEYELAKRALAPDRTHGRDKDSDKLSASLLERRDKFIASRINSTLCVGEVGIIFLGMLHSLEPWLDPDIEVIFPFFRPIGHATVAAAKGR